MLFLADTGVCIGEASALQGQVLDLADGTARIARSADHTGRVGPTKTPRERGDPFLRYMEASSAQHQNS